MLLLVPFVHAGGVWAAAPTLKWSIVRPAHVGRKTHRSTEKQFSYSRRPSAKGPSRWMTLELELDHRHAEVLFDEAVIRWCQSERCSDCTSETIWSRADIVKFRECGCFKNFLAVCCDCCSVAPLPSRMGCKSKERGCGGRLAQASPDGANMLHGTCVFFSFCFVNDESL